MKNLILTLCFIGITLANAQIVLETSAVSDTNTSELSVQRIEYSTDLIDIKYDYKRNADDVFGISLPKIYSDSTTSIGGLFIKQGDGKSSDQYIFDAFINKRIGSVDVMLEIGRMISEETIPLDFAGTRVTYRDFTVECYYLAPNSWAGHGGEGEGIYAWAAYHPKHAYFSLGLQDKQYWAFIGTQGRKEFNQFTFFNFNPEHGNYWMRAQAGFGNTNQGFFNEGLYNFATSYMVVPVFFYQHFSPIASKGDYGIKFDAKRSGKLEKFELLVSKKIGNDLFRIAAGVVSQNCTGQLKTAPCFELYKELNLKNAGNYLIEARYDVLCEGLSIFLKCSL